MESWNHIIDTALLGTDKRPLQKEDVGPELADSVDVLLKGRPGAEDAFLQTAAMMYNYRRCGVLPLRNEAVTIVPAGEEEKGYASSAAHGALHRIMEVESISLLRFWLQQCVGKEKVVEPEVIPVLLDAGIKQKQIGALAYACCGERGVWLAPFNESWKRYTAITSDDDVWLTGTLEQRKNFLAAIRNTDPAMGREMLQQVWPQEAAAAKTELLQQLAVNAGDDDVVWLEEVLNEKSVKVKDEALHLLKKIPASSLVQLYWTILKNAVTLTTSKGLLGFGAKTNLEIKLEELDKAIFKTGIEPLSADKSVTDESFVLSQLIGSVPPHLWEGNFNLDKKKILEVFLKNEKGKSLLPAFGAAAARFGDAEWMRAVIAADSKSFYAGALHVLPQKEAAAYALSFFHDDRFAATIIADIHYLSDEWGMDFTKALLRYTARNPYQYHRGFYNEIAHLLPVAIAPELEKCTPKEEHLRNMWNSVSEHITKLLMLKSETLTAFND